MTAFGTFKTDLPAPVSSLSLTFSRLDFVTSWRKCSRLADFIAQHIAEDLDDKPTAAAELSGFLNELIENSIKFSKPGSTEVSLELPFWGDRITVITRYLCTIDQAERFAAWIDRVDNSDPESLFIEQVLKTAESSPDTSGLGLITLRKDHQAQVGLLVEPQKTDAMITFQAHVPLNDFVVYPEIPQALPSRSLARTGS